MTEVQTCALPILLIGKVDQAVERINQVLAPENQAKLTQALAEVGAAAASADRLARTADQTLRTQLDPARADLPGLIRQASSTLKATEGVATDARRTLATLDAVAGDARQGLARLSGPGGVLERVDEGASTVTRTTLPQLQNLTEESGVYDEAEYAELAAIGIEREWIEGIPHPQLFRRFREATGIVAPYLPENDAVELTCWRESFLATLTFGSAAEALGALGLGTENVVSTIYKPFVKALTRSSLAPRDSVFFPLHTAVDDHHQEALEEISMSFASAPNGKTGLRKGMIKALSLRSAYWDWLYERAMSRIEQSVAA